MKSPSKLSLGQYSSSFAGWFLLLTSSSLLGPSSSKAAKHTRYKTPSTCRATLFRCKFWVDVSRFSPCVINLPRNKNVWCGSEKAVAKTRARVYFEQQILAFCSSFFIKLNFSRNKFAHVARQVEDFCISYFAALKPGHQHVTSPNLSPYATHNTSGENLVYIETNSSRWSFTSSSRPAMLTWWWYRWEKWGFHHSPATASQFFQPRYSLSLSRTSSVGILATILSRSSSAGKTS